MLNIQGIQKTTLLDYPGCVASTVFLGGCNMRCPFCHNMNIVTSPGPGPYTEEDVLQFLSGRRGILDGVCITGGEPTLYDELPDFAKLIKGMGFKVKLDTNGTNPVLLKDLIDRGIVDYIAMDIKSSFAKYETACGIPGIKLTPIKESIDILINGKTDYEFRTTAVEEFLEEEDIDAIGIMLKGARRYYLQGYVESEFVPDKTIHAVSKEKLLQYKQKLSKYISQTEIRGISYN